MSDEPIDFSPLDPQRDAVRWQGMVNAIADKAIVAPSLWQAIAGGWRLALGLAAAGALAVWLITPPPPSRQAQAALLTWAGDPTGANAAELFARLEGAQ